MRACVPLMFLLLVACTKPAAQNPDTAAPAEPAAPAVTAPAPMAEPPMVEATPVALPEPAALPVAKEPVPSRPQPVLVQPAAPPAPKMPGMVGYPASKGPIDFNHAGHAGRLGCNACHKTDPPQKIVINSMATGHALCKTCHQASGGKAPTKCDGCHQRP